MIILIVIHIFYKVKLNVKLFMFRLTYLLFVEDFLLYMDIFSQFNGINLIDTEKCIFSKCELNS